MSRNWRPRSVFVCPIHHVWSVRVHAPRCRVKTRTSNHQIKVCDLRCEKIEGERLNDQMRRHLERVNA